MCLKFKSIYSVAERPALGLNSVQRDNFYMQYKQKLLIIIETTFYKILKQINMVAFISFLKKKTRIVNNSVKTQKIIVIASTIEYSTIKLTIYSAAYQKQIKIFFYCYYWQ